MTPSTLAPRSPYGRRQSGVTLVELMVGLAIALIVSLAAAALYLATRETNRAMQSHTDINETAKIALDMIGREIQKAGFYPAQFTTPADVSKAGRYYNGKTGALFATGLRGCDGAAYKPDTHTCDTTVAGAPDSIIVNYFTSPEFGAGSLVGNANDCNRMPVSADPDNIARAAGFPMFVSNRFGLVDVNYVSGDGQTIAARALACHGNGEDAKATAQAHVQGVIDMVIRYGITAGGTVLSQSPTRFLTATQISAQPNDAEGRTPWERVTAVHVCIVVRSMENARISDDTTTVRTYRNCRGGTTAMPAGNRFLFGSHERTFAVRNNLNSLSNF